MTTALLALADASASSAGAGPALRPGQALTVKSDRHAPSPIVDRASDADNPFEHGRLPLIGDGVAAASPISSKPAVASHADAALAESALPERPPRG